MVVLPLVPVTATTGIFGVMVVGPVALLGRAHLLGRRAHRRLDVGRRQRVERVRDGLAERPGAAAVAPREGHDEHVGVGGRAHAYGEATGAGLAGDGAHQPLDRAQGEPLAEARSGRARPRRAQPDAAGEPQHGLVAGLGDGRDVERQLHRGTREVEVGAFEDAQLDE